eukprot:scaffold112502_cov45-Phaeocystis_antarctica.AAC.1
MARLSADGRRFRMPASRFSVRGFRAGRVSRSRGSMRTVTASGTRTGILPTRDMARVAVLSTPPPSGSRVATNLRSIVGADAGLRREQRTETKISSGLSSAYLSTTCNVQWVFHSPAGEPTLHNPLGTFVTMTVGLRLSRRQAVRLSTSHTHTRISVCGRKRLSVASCK